MKPSVLISLWEGDTDPLKTLTFSFVVVLKQFYSCIIYNKNLETLSQIFPMSIIKMWRQRVEREVHSLLAFSAVKLLKEHYSIWSKSFLILGTKRYQFGHSLYLLFEEANIDVWISNIKNKRNIYSKKQDKKKDLGIILQFNSKWNLSNQSFIQDLNSNRHE